MGSRYDVAVLRDVTLSRFTEAFVGDAVLGARVDRPWEGSSGVTIAQVDTDRGSNVVVVAPAMKTPRGVDTRLAGRLGVEVLLGTVWDSVSVYSLLVLGDGVDREVADDPEDGSLRRGTPLPEEPSWPDVDEAWVQTVVKGRTGIDPGRIDDHPADWYAFGPPATPDR